MKHTVTAEEAQFVRVAWGLTKNLVGPQTMNSKYLKVNITEYLPGHVHEPHAHPDQEEVIYVLSGRGHSEVDRTTREIGPGSFAFVPAGARHQTVNASDTESMVAVIIKSPPDKEA